VQTKFYRASIKTSKIHLFWCASVHGSEHECAHYLPANRFRQMKEIIIMYN